MMNTSQTIVYRLTETTLMVDDLMVDLCSDGFYRAVNGEKIGIIRLQALFKYLAEESEAKRKKFYKYVDKTIKQLLYNEH